MTFGVSFCTLSLLRNISTFDPRNIPTATISQRAPCSLAFREEREGREERREEEEREWRRREEEEREGRDVEQRE